MKLGQKGISGLIATMLLMIVLVSAFLVFDLWMQGFAEKTMNEADLQAGVEPTLEYLENDSLYLRNKGKRTMNITRLAINGTVCSYTNENVGLGITKIDVSGCAGPTQNMVDVVVTTNRGVYASKLFHENG